MSTLSLVDRPTQLICISDMYVNRHIQKTWQDNLLLRPYHVFKEAILCLWGCETDSEGVARNGLRSKKQEQQPTQATEEPELTIYGVEGSQQWISAGLDGGCPKRPPRPRSWWKHSRGIWSVANPCPHLLKGQNLVVFTPYFHDGHNLTTDPAIWVHLTLHAGS